MTPPDILILALPLDRARAEQVLDGLHQANIASLHATRIETVDPRSPGWVAVSRLARDARCVLFCWSRHTAAPDAAPLRALGENLFAGATAISVELDRGSRPAELAGSTTYPAYGWRCRPGALLRFLFGDIHRLQIAVAAQRKVSGQDPPPPAAFWELLRGRGWVAIVGVFALIGTFSTLWGLWNDDALAKMADPALAAQFDKARDTRNCLAMHQFSDANPGSPWAAGVTEFLANCQMRDVPTPRTIDRTMPIFGANTAEATANAQSVCASLAANLDGRLLAATLASFTPGGEAKARCRVIYKQLVPQEIYVAKP